MHHLARIPERPHLDFVWPFDEDGLRRLVVVPFQRAPIRYATRFPFLRRVVLPLALLAFLSACHTWVPLPSPGRRPQLVISTLVLCTVEDPEKAVLEVRRVLRPGGRFVFLEHVAADPGSRLRAAQDILRRPWAWFAEGCQLNRNTAATIREAGFRELAIERFDGPRWTPIRPHVAGIAIR